MGTTNRSSVVCGSLIVGGFHGHALTASFEKALATGERGGAILFRRNIPSSFDELRTLTKSIREVAKISAIVGVDQEGGRVARIGKPAMVIPPARELASQDPEAIFRLAEAQGRELASLGFTINFAPVLDIDSCATNPVIGDRSFGKAADDVVRSAIPFALGLQNGGVAACAKHFPGHGDTTRDSHFDLPVVDAAREQLQSREWLPFKAAAAAGVRSMMTAHVVYPAVDTLPATLSHRFCTEILRDFIGFRGALFSDDLEMKALADRYSIEDSATLAIEAGCDALLVCSDEEMQSRAHEALCRRYESNARFRERCDEASMRIEHFLRSNNISAHST